ncbi:MAG: ribosome biogenesis GTPase Der [Deltaproteobacteria bacterium]|nr:ribosome biogenesis GTPase Der [Deltaproteobacteria bacterium]
MTYIVAIVGCPNVGKSTLFNRLSRSKDSLVDDCPGITRDSLYAPVSWDETPFTLVDTGGFDDENEDRLTESVKRQVLKAVEESDRIIFLMDGQKGLMPGDEEMAVALRRFKKKIFYVVNKVDGPEKEYLLHDFYRLGADSLYPVSGAHGYGLRTLMDEVVAGLPKEKPAPGDDSQIRVAILGRPNAGKSSLINRILGFERMIVSEIPGTTRDSVDILFRRNDREYLLIDTAGIRRKSKVKERIDKFSMIKALKSLERCHVAVILFDAGEGFMEQDARICGYALDRYRGLILGINKYDLIKSEPGRKKALDLAVDRQLNFASFAPRLNLSALTGENVKKLFDKIDMVYDQFSTRVGTGEVNRLIEDMVLKRPPPMVGSRRLKFFYATQIDIRPPTFVVFVNYPDAVHFSYHRFIINQLRGEFGLKHTPIKLIIKKRTGDKK